MVKYFILNFLSFQSINAISLFFTMKRECGLHGTCDFDHCKRYSVHAGYCISHTFKQLYEYFLNTSFILIEEDPAVILNHLLFGYYNNCYDEKIIEDFKQYFDIDLTNLTLEKVTKLSDIYYMRVKEQFKDNLIIIDLKKHNNSFLQFLNSNDFVLFYEKLKYSSRDAPMVNHEDRIAQVRKDTRIYKDFFITSENYAIPTHYPMNGIMNNSFLLKMNTLNSTYLTSFLDQIKVTLQENSTITVEMPYNK